MTSETPNPDMFRTDAPDMYRQYTFDGEKSKPDMFESTIKLDFQKNSFSVVENADSQGNTQPIKDQKIDENCMSEKSSTYMLHLNMSGNNYKISSITKNQTSEHVRKDENHRNGEDLGNIENPDCDNNKQMFKEEVESLKNKTMLSTLIAEMRAFVQATPGLMSERKEIVIDEFGLKYPYYVRRYGRDSIEFVAGKLSSKGWKM